MSLRKTHEFLFRSDRRADVVLDPSLSARIGEASDRRTHHLKLAETLDVEALSYASQPLGVMYKLDGDDILHFRLVEGARKDEL